MDLAPLSLSIRKSLFHYAGFSGFLQPDNHWEGWKFQFGSDVIMEETLVVLTEVGTKGNEELRRNMQLPEKASSTWILYSLTLRKLLCTHFPHCTAVCNNDR